MLAGTRCRVLWILLPLMTVGCRGWPWRGGGTAPSVVTCRDLSTQGRAAIEQGNWPQAEKLMAAAVAACPVDVDARRHYAQTLLQRNATTEALAQLDEALRLANHDVSLAVHSGEIYLSLGQIEAAQRRADLALRIDSASAEAWALRGRIKAVRGDARAALADFQRALGYRHDDRRVLHEVAQLYRILDRPDRALVCLQALGETYRAGEEPRELLVEQAQTLTAVARFGDAAATYERVLRKGAPAPELHFALAHCYLAAGQPAKAAHAAQSGLALAPDDSRGRELMARMAEPLSGAPLRR
jgi:tetratricopeptide (TPR) repeat protein